MQRDDELVSLEKLKDELGSKGYKYFKLLQEDLENMDLILALEMILLLLVRVIDIYQN